MKILKMVVLIFGMLVSCHHGTSQQIFLTFGGDISKSNGSGHFDWESLAYGGSLGLEFHDGYKLSATATASFLETPKNTATDLFGKKFAHKVTTRVYMAGVKFMALPRKNSEGGMFLLAQIGATTEKVKQYDNEYHWLSDRAEIGLALGPGIGYRYKYVQASVRYLMVLTFGRASHADFQLAYLLPLRKLK